MSSQVLAVALALAALATSAQAAVTVTFQQVGANVVATASGSIGSYAGLTLTSNQSISGNGQFVASRGPFLGMGPITVNWAADTISGVGLTRPANLGTTSSSFIKANTFTGSFNFWASNTIDLPRGYVFGTEFDQVSTWNDKTFTSLGLVEGTYTWSWAGDSLSIVVGGTPVPEPSTYGLILGGLALAGAAIRRRRKQSA
ncbi:MAG: PEP-CTERM sorting domain-containing protein [Opitutia bacterium]|jgi:hypothetical protein